MSLNGVIVYGSIIGYIITNVLIGETTQVADEFFNYPYILWFINNLQGALINIMFMLLWICYKAYYKLPINIIVKDAKEYNALKYFILYSSLTAILATVSQILLNMSLVGNVITVPTSNAISGMQPVVVFILSLLFLKQQVQLNLQNVIVVVLTIIGVLFFVVELSFANRNHHNTETYDTYYGILLTMTWTIGFAIYDIMLKRLCIYCLHKDSFIIGSVWCRVIQGITSTIVFWWVLIYPQEVILGSNLFSTNAWLCISVNGVTLCIDALLEVICIALTSPFYLNIASQISIPLAFTVDVFIHNYQFNVYAVLGAVFIIISVLLLQIKPDHKLYSLMGFGKHKRGIQQPILKCQISKTNMGIQLKNN
eukprot:393359_1